MKPVVVKRTVIVAGQKTSLCLEHAFWRGLREIAAWQDVSLPELIASIDTAMSASGLYGKTKVCAGIVGHADLTLGDKVEPVLTAHIRAGGDRFRGIRHITAWDADASVRNPAYSPPPGLLAD